MVQDRRLGRCIRASFQSDRDYHALQAGHAIMANLGEDEVMAAKCRAEPVTPRAERCTPK